MEGQQPPADNERNPGSAQDADDGTLGIEQVKNRAITVQLAGGAFHLSLSVDGGSITSDLHYDSLEAFLDDYASGDPGAAREAFGRFEGAIDTLESFVLAASQAGIEVQSDAFRAALQKTLDAFGNRV